MAALGSRQVDRSVNYPLRQVPGLTPFLFSLTPGSSFCFALPVLHHLPSRPALFQMLRSHWLQRPLQQQLRARVLETAAYGDTVRLTDRDTIMIQVFLKIGMKSSSVFLNACCRSYCERFSFVCFDYWLIYFQFYQNVRIGPSSESVCLFSGDVGRTSPII